MFFGAGYWENATLAGMLPDLNWSKMLLRTDLTLSFIFHLLWFVVLRNRKPREGRGEPKKGIPKYGLHQKVGIYEL